MSTTFSVDDAEAAGRLISYGLRPKHVPARNAAYADLVRRYREDDTFQQLTKGFAAGLGLMILEVSPRAGIVVAATNESAFEIKLDSYAKRAKIRERDVEKVLHGVIHLAVAALCFPRPDDLANDTYVGRVSVEQVDAAVREACRVLDEKVGGNDDPPADAPELEQVWRAYARRPEVMSTRGGKTAAAATRGMVKRALGFLAAQGLLVSLRGDEGEVYRTTPRYQVQVRELAANNAFQELLDLGIIAITAGTGTLLPASADTLMDLGTAIDV
jgi:hypothetical protein